MQSHTRAVQQADGAAAGEGAGGGAAAAPEEKEEEEGAAAGIDGGRQDEDEVLLRDLQMMLIDEAGHNLQLDNPLAFTAAMQAYLGRGEHCTGRTFVAGHVEVL